MVETRIRESCPSPVHRTLECVGGPWDSEMRTLEPEETELELSAGRYTAVRVRRGEQTMEYLRWERESEK